MKSKRWIFMSAAVVGIAVGVGANTGLAKIRYCEQNMCNYEEGKCTRVEHDYNCDEVVGDTCEDQKCTIVEE